MRGNLLSWAASFKCFCLLLAWFELCALPRTPLHKSHWEFNLCQLSQVWLARCKPFDAQVAIKMVDLEIHENNLVRGPTCFTLCRVLAINNILRTAEVCVCAYALCSYPYSHLTYAAVLRCYMNETAKLPFSHFAGSADS